MITVALTYNLVKDEYLKSKPIDFIAEYDSIETINALKYALESGDYSVVLIEADENAYSKFRELKNEIDIVFNIAEGEGGETREAYIPAILDMLKIPYTGSGVWTLVTCLNKAKTKQVLEYNKIATPKFQVINSLDFELNNNLKFSLIVKLLHEGSQIGLDYCSVVYDLDELKKEAARQMNTYNEAVIIEEYLDGREFTVPIVGNYFNGKEPIVLPIIEVVFDKVPEGKPKINIFVPDDPVLERMDKLGISRDTINTESNHSSVCPANISKELEERIKKLALRTFKALDCKDWCRLEIREDKDGNLYVLEVNPIAGIDPSYFFPKSAKVYGWNYNELICKILEFALERNGIVEL